MPKLDRKIQTTSKEIKAKASIQLHPINIEQHTRLLLTPQHRQPTNLHLEN
jgi:hypothetical protein